MSTEPSLDLAFVLVPEAKYPDPAQVIATGERMGLSLRPGTAGEPQSFELPDGKELLVMLIPAPHPDVPGMALGVTSPSREELVAAPAHLIVTLLGGQGEVRERDAFMAACTGAIAVATNAVAAMLGHGVVFHKAKPFAEIAALAMEDEALPAEIAVDVTVAPEADERVSFLTHGMTRYGREEFYVTCPTSGKGALAFVFMLANWMLKDREKHLPTGDTVGRTAQEKVRIQRVPNPSGKDGQVVRLDLAS